MDMIKSLLGEETREAGRKNERDGLGGKEPRSLVITTGPLLPNTVLAAGNGAIIYIDILHIDVNIIIRNFRGNYHLAKVDMHDSDTQLRKANSLSAESWFRKSSVKKSLVITDTEINIVIYVLRKV